jgi:phage terminase large subunit GpA-like protein
MITPALSRQICDTIRPRVFVPTGEWAEKNINLPRSSEITGKFKLSLFPHIREPLECFDDPYYRSISMQMASRLGKTVFGQVCLCKTAATNPHPMALADADEKSTRRVFKRTWDILEQVACLREQIPPRSMRSMEQIQLTDCLIHGAWSGSASTAADYAALIVMLNEIDKMTTKLSGEADFAFLMEERCKGYRHSKILRISTPGRRDSSRIEAARLAGDNRARKVPCPFCNHYQVLRTGDGKKPGGLRWDKSSNGHSTPAIALETAWYECEKCIRKILDEYRRDMLNAGVWIKEGQDITPDGKIIGKPARPGPDASFGPLHSLHSLLPSMTLGKIAHAFLISRPNKEKRRNWVNSWEGETWEDRPEKITPHQLALRLGSQEPPRLCPVWSVFLTSAVDVQEHATHFKYYCCAWGPHGRGALIDYVELKSWDELREYMLAKAEYPHADGGRPLRPSLTGIDSGDGNVTPQVYAFCRSMRACYPLKGSSTSRFPEALRPSAMDEDRKGSDKKKKFDRGDVCLLEVNTQLTQEYVQERIDGDIKPTAAGLVFAQCGRDE